MPIVTPVIVQQAALSAPVQPGSEPGYPTEYNMLTLPNPVTVGNQLVLICLGGTTAAPTTGWAQIAGSGLTFGDNWAAGGVYTQTAATPVPPVIPVPMAGFVTSGAILMEIANSSQTTGILGVSGNAIATPGNTCTLPQMGAVSEVASLYVVMTYCGTNGLTYSNPQPPGAALGPMLEGVNIWESGPWGGVEIFTTSTNPVTFEFTASAQGIAEYYVGFIAYAGNEVEPIVPPENLAQPSGTQDVVYVVVERIAVHAGVPYRYYTIELMASRLLGGNLAQAVPNDIEYSWAVDAGVQVAPSSPGANLWITPGNVGAVSGVDIVVGGDGYPAEVVATIIDLEGSGSSAAATFTVTNGVITAYDLTAGGSGYVQPEIQLAPSTGDGAVLTASVSNTCTIYADAAIWTAGDVGQIIRAAGGKVQITSVTDTRHIVCAVLEPFTQFIPNTAQPASCLSGEWTQGPQITQLPYLDHLEGQQVVGLADGAVFGPLTVTNGAIALPNAASIVTAGLGFTAQLKTLRLDLGNQGGGTVQTKRKKVSAVTLRVQDTQGLTVGSTWATMTPMKAAGFAPSNAAVPFSEGGGNQKSAVNGLYGQEPVRYLDQRIITGGGWDPDGQICIQQANPLPMSLLAIIPEITVGDT